MPDASGPTTASDKGGCSLSDLRVGHPDSIGVKVREIIFRGADYIIYLSEQGIYVHFSDDGKMRQKQRHAYTLLSPQLCELRYLSSQIQPTPTSRKPRKQGNGRLGPSVSLYDHNMAQALMLLMESVAQRETHVEPEAAAKELNTTAQATEDQASRIAKRALDMAVDRVTADNTIRYVRQCVYTAVLWVFLAAAVALAHAYGSTVNPAFTDLLLVYPLAVAMGAIGAAFSVSARAQAFDLKPCEDSRLNAFMSMIRAGVGAISGLFLYMLLTTILAGKMGDSGSMTSFPVVAIIGFVGGFAERLVPRLVQSAAATIEGRAGTASQAVASESRT